MDDLFLSEPAISRSVREHDEPGIEVRVNFGVFAGRDATPAELDRLAEWLLDEVGEVSIISDTARHTMRSYREHERATPSV